jgi:pyridoxine kinase
MNILSIQSWVCYGHVGNAAALFPLQRLGAEVWTVNTVQFSNHPGYGDFTGDVLPADHVIRLIDGIAARGALGRCDAVLSGYLGEAAVGAAILDAVARVKAASPGALYCADPVIGDTGPGVYVRAGVAEFIRDRVVPTADILTPNLFELGYLTGRAAMTRPEILAAIDALHARGPRTVLVTSVATDETPADAIDMICSEGGERHLLRTPRIGRHFNGAGDAISALFLFHRLDSGSAAAALATAGSAIHGLLKRTAAAGERELLLVAAQSELVAPSRRFDPVPI